MIASHRAAEITFYEELGVAPGASPEEIRNAFRTLVRLFHPDQQTDPQLKDIAEKQMRKLNRVYAVLSDPESRRRYDEVLDRQYKPAVVIGPVFKSGLRQFMGRMASFLAIILGAGLLIWLTPETTPGPLSFAHDQNGPVPYGVTALSAAVADQAPLIATLRSDLKAVTLERSFATRELSRLRAAQSGESGEPERQAGVRNGVSAGHNLSGVWVYAKPAQGPDSDGQPLEQPERIEATITEQNGGIYGRYRARLRVGNRAVPPDVSFSFVGAAGEGSQLTFPWTSVAGTKGEVALKILSANSLQIDWHATEPGAPRGFDAGSAILTRQIE